MTQEAPESESMIEAKSSSSTTTTGQCERSFITFSDELLFRKVFKRNKKS